MITLRQFVYALLWLCFGFAGMFGLMTDWRAASLLSFLVGVLGPIGIITFGQLDTLARPRKLFAYACLAMVCAVAGVYFVVIYRVPTKVLGEGIMLTEQDALALVRAPSAGRLVSVRSEGRRSGHGGKRHW